VAAQEGVPGVASIGEALASAAKGRLVGRKCLGCSRVSFIDEVRCPACRKEQFARVESKGEGEVVAFTVVGFPAEAFVAYGPYAFVVVKMNEGGETSGWMPSVRDPRDIKVGARVRVVPSPEGRGIAFEKV
jgi:uncharacterized OB-fold protein